jgi:hypothetical protein
VATLVPRNARIWWRLWWSVEESAFGGSLESGGRFCVGAFSRNLASVDVKMFPHLIPLIKTLFKFCTFNVVCKDNAAVNYINVQHKKRYIPVNFNGSHYAIILRKYITTTTGVRITVSQSVSYMALIIPQYIQWMQINCELQLRHSKRGRKDGKRRGGGGAIRQTVCLSMYSVTENIFSPFNFDTIGVNLITLAFTLHYIL